MRTAAIFLIGLTGLAMFLGAMALNMLENYKAKVIKDGILESSGDRYAVSKIVPNLAESGVPIGGFFSLDTSGATVGTCNLTPVEDRE